MPSNRLLSLPISRMPMHNYNNRLTMHDFNNHLPMHNYTNKLPKKGNGLKLAGQGIKLAGQGWKKGVGGTLIGLGLLGGLGNLDDKPIEGILGGAILSGLGGYLVHLENKQAGKGFKPIFDNRFKEALEKSLQYSQIGGAIDTSMIQQVVEDNLDKKIGIEDIFGKNWKMRGKQLYDTISKAQKGSGIFQDIGKTIKKGYKGAKKLRDKALDKLKDFSEGKTKFKPSDLLNITAGAVGAAGAASAFIPGVDLISVPSAAAASLGLKSAATIAKTAGRGMEGGEIDAETLYKIGDAAIIAGILGISTVAAKKILNKVTKKYKGSGIKLSGEGVVLAGGAMENIPHGICYTKSGKIKRDRYSVYYGYYDKTKSGLTKNDFVKKGNKIVSKKKQLQGKKAIKYLRK